MCLFSRGGGRAEGFILQPFLWVECRAEREKSSFWYSIHCGPPLRGFVMQEVSLGPHQQLLWVAESQITQFLRWGFQSLSSCILCRQPKKLLVKEKQICSLYIYVNFYTWDFSSVEFTVFCKVNLFFQWSNVTPETKDPILDSDELHKVCNRIEFFIKHWMLAWKTKGSRSWSSLLSSIELILKNTKKDWNWTWKMG